MRANTEATVILLAACCVATLASAVLEGRSTPIMVSFAPQSTVIGIADGQISGVEAFNGIPYAQPPLGQLRLKPPQKLTTPPVGIINGTKTARTCSQYHGSVPIFPDVFTQLISSAINTTFFQTPIPSSEDCLTLNIIRPKGTKAGDLLPVVFWIHGGGFQVGSATQYDGSYFVANSMELRKPIIYVAVNYRLGGFGFMPGREILANGSANIGLLDQRMGLQWVAEHIVAFGGDPSKVTMWGQSAGSISVFDQLGLYGGNHEYEGKPLFHGAILNSGSMFLADPIDCPKAQAIYDTVVKKSGCEGSADTLACLRSVDYEVFVEATNSFPGFLSYSSISLPYLPRPDGMVMEASPEDLTKSGRYAAVPLIIGGQEDEGTLFSLSQTNLSSTAAVVDYLASTYFPGAPKQKLHDLVESYDTSITAGSPYGMGAAGEIYPGFKRLAALLGDIGFTLMRRVFLSTALKVKPSTPTWSYLATYDNNTPVLGTFHGSDLLPVFFGGPQTFASRALMSYYTNFAYTLDPNAAKAGDADYGSYPQWPEWKVANELLRIARDDAVTSADNFRASSYSWLVKNHGLLHF